MAQDFSICWDINTLNKVYRQGYLAGVMGMSNNKCPYIGEVIEAAWEAGWEDGIANCELSNPITRIA